MTRFRSLFLATLVLVPLGLEFGCGGDDKKKTVYIVPEGGIGDPGASCEPVNVPEAVFNASPINQALCTDDDVATVVLSCGSADNASQQACEAAKSQLAACASCIIGSPTDPNAHPGYQYNPGTLALPSPSACMLALAKTDDEKKCAIAYGQIETCSLSSCLTPCLDQTGEQFQECLTSALNTTCTKGTDVYSTDVCQNLYNGTTYGFCTSNKAASGQELTDDQYFFGIASIYCGGLDGGTVQPPPPDDDAGDAGAADARDD